MEVEIHVATDIGRVRRLNEDNYLLLNLSNHKFWTKLQNTYEFVVQSNKFEVDNHGIILAVSDGCGGALAGEIASEMAVETVKRMLNGEVPDLDESFYKGQLIEKLYDAALYTNQLIHTCQRNDSQYSGMGCTLTAAVITPEAADFIQVGDSRGYLVRKDKIYPITKDQSLVNQLIDKGLIKPEEAETHALKNVILQALGAQNEVFPDLWRLIPQKNDILLLCSDGLSNKLKDVDLLKIILDNSNDLKKACQILLDEANINGGEDNITVILAKLLGSDLLEPTDEKVVIYPLTLGKSARLC